MERLAREPLHQPDLEETGPSGRKHTIRARERIILTCRVDHAVKEVRVIRVEIC